MTPEAIIQRLAAEPQASMPGTIPLRMPYRASDTLTVHTLWNDPSFDGKARARGARARGAVTLNVRELRPSQDKVNRAHMVQIVTDARARALPVIVLRSAGKLIIVDGHHRVYAKRLLGEKTVLAYLVDAPAPGWFRRAGV